MSLSWQTVCHIDALPERSAQTYPFHGVSYFVIKFDNQIYAYLNACPHRQIELEWQENDFFDLDKDYLQCATHGALFLPQTGECISGPCQQQSLKKVATRVKAEKIQINI